MKVFTLFEIQAFENRSTKNTNKKDTTLCCNTHQLTGARKLL
jgi:hypothetical protein